MEDKDTTAQEAEYAGFVDRGTQVVLQEAIQKVVETFSQTDAMEDILGYLEEMRENIQNGEERVKQIQQREKQISDKVAATEISTRNLLQRIQSMEVQLDKTCKDVGEFKEDLARVTKFFEMTPLARMFSRLKSKDEIEESDLEAPVSPQLLEVRPKYGKPLPKPEKPAEKEAPAKEEKDAPAEEKKDNGTDEFPLENSQAKKTTAQDNGTDEFPLEDEEDED